MISRLQWLLLALAVGATVALTWRWELDGPPDETAARHGNGPDLYMEGAVIDQFDDAGALRYRLTAASIAHYPDEGITRVTAPVLALLQPGAAPWEARARFGEVRSPPAGSDGRPQSETVLLRQQVQLEQKRGDGTVRLRTERLTIQPLARTAQTDLPVIIDTETGRTVAAGMRGELETGRIALTSGSRQRVTTVVHSRPL